MFTYKVQEKAKGLSTQWFSHDHFGKRPRHLPAPIHHPHWVLITQRALGARLCFDSKVIFQRLLNPLLQLPAQGGGKFLKVKTIKTLQSAALHWRTTAETGLAWFIQDKPIDVRNRGNVFLLFFLLQGKAQPKNCLFTNNGKIIVCTCRQKKSTILYDSLKTKGKLCGNQWWKHIFLISLL